ncbi:MAG: DMT family transporter [Leptolyngbyaceae bacterium]|nr:DMT family transporter [Leptolyngbyaceae bacterium]
MSFFTLLRSRRFWFRCQICLYLTLSLLSGALLPIQASMNAQLARSLTSAPMAANVSYLVGFLALAGLLLTHRFEHPDWSALSKAPHWSLTGGVFGAWYIASSAYFISALGATLTLGFVVFGQAIAGIVADHFGWLGLPRHRLTPYRRIAIGMFIVALFFLIQ